MEISNIVKMFNEEGLTLKDIAERASISKSTIQRRLVADGWQYNKKTGKYEKNVPHEAINNETNVNSETSNTETNVNNETINTVNRTYSIPEDIDRALKIKCAIEGKKAIDVVREALRNAIDPKYFDLK